MEADWITPEWPAPARVRAVSTTRRGGMSRGVFSSLNLGAHVGDDATAVAENRRRLISALGLQDGLIWLEQVHGKEVARLTSGMVKTRADAAVTERPRTACVVMTADCLPVLICDRVGSRIAAAHAGWRGLNAGILEATVAAMGAGASELMAWLGPAIGPRAYEVGDELRRVFIEHDPEATKAFIPGRSAGKWWCDLYELARQRLQSVGLSAIYGGRFCTYTDSERFFSFRRDGECGRMATLIYKIE